MNSYFFTHKKTIGIGVFVVLVLLSVTVVFMRSHRTLVSEEETRRAPSLSFPAYREVFSPESLAGKRHIVVTWATWCALCTDVLRDVERVHAEHDGLPIIAVNRAEYDAIARPYLMREFPNSPIIFLHDADDRYFKEMEGFAMPELLFISENGEVLLHHRGPITYDALSTYLTTLGW